jgi:molecular chaperone GrpE
MMSTGENAADKAIREALESVEKLERQGAADDAAVVFDDEVSADSTEEAPPPRKTVADAMVEALLKSKQEMQDVLSQTQKEAKDLYDRLTRVSADFENFKKRQQREKEDVIKFGNEKILKEFLPVLDNLHRALSVGSEGAQLTDGVRLVTKQFEDTFGKFGVQGFTALHEPFDPARHEAVGSRPSADVAAQHVVEEYQRGYLLSDRLLRPALVIVSSGIESEPN